MKVYVSSTSLDLKEHRNRVYRALRKSQHEVIAMEDYASTSSRPLKKSLDDVAACDVYVGIFAWRYGHIPRADNSAGLSITELEYRKAVESNKHICIFLLDLNAPWPPGLMDTHTGDADSGRKIQRLREQLAEDWVVDFFSSPEDLASKVAPSVHNAYLSLQEAEVIGLKAQSAVPKSQQHQPPSEHDNPSQQRLEKVFGTRSPGRTLAWWKRAIDCSSSVAKISDFEGQPWGTGFIVAGGDLHPEFGSDPVVVTASYIVADKQPAFPSALKPQNVRLDFEVADIEQCAITDVLWESPPDELSTIVLRIPRPPSRTHSYKIAKRSPLNGSDAFVIGYPRGGNLCISTRDAEIVDQDDRVLHYRTPTQPGVGGSPVFNADWELIGVHHAGSPRMPRLNNRSGTYAANAGIKITAIKAAIARDI